MKLSFKKGAKPTGLYSVGNPYPDTQIKADKKQVGIIGAPNWASKTNSWKIRFRVKDSTSKSGFKWITLTYEAPDEEDARKFIERNWETICKKYELHQMDD